MKVLILEDNKERIKLFKKAFKASDYCFIVDSVKQAKKVYEENTPFDIIFLDHDLDNRQYVSSLEENTGYQFAKYLAEKKAIGRIIVHSLNVVGARNICNLLPQAERIPFTILVKNLNQ